MAIKSILLHLDDSAVCDTRLQCAAMLARYFEAQLTGIYIERPFVPVSSGSVELSPGVDRATAHTDIETHRALLEREKRNIQKRLNHFTNPDSTPISWRTTAGEVQHALFDDGRCHDLIIIDKDLGNDGLLGILSEPAANIAVNVPCPVLALPAKPVCMVPVKQPLVAWNASREASRAVIDALPFLRFADRVTVFNGHDKDMAPQNIEARKTGILDYLQLHEVEADFIDSGSTGDHLGEILIERIREAGHDLIVMGAYGHSQLRELFFGSVSRHLLRNTTVPVLLSH